MDVVDKDFVDKVVLSFVVVDLGVDNEVVFVLAWEGKRICLEGIGNRAYAGWVASLEPCIQVDQEIF